MKNYEPELGQLFFGNRWERYDAPAHVLSAIETISNLLTELHATKYRRYRSGGWFSPISNTRAEFVNGTFTLRAYQWSECICTDDYPNIRCVTCKPNFQWKDIEVRWYKHLHRGTTINRDVSADECSTMLQECLASLRTMDWSPIPLLKPCATPRQSSSRSTASL